MRHMHGPEAHTMHAFASHHACMRPCACIGCIGCTSSDRVLQAWILVDAISGIPRELDDGMLSPELP